MYTHTHTHEWQKVVNMTMELKVAFQEAETREMSQMQRVTSGVKMLTQLESY